MAIPMRVWLGVALLVVLVCIWIWDVWCIVQGDTSNTVSVTIMEWSIQWPILPLLVGIGIGHLFWPNQ